VKWGSERVRSHECGDGLAKRVFGVADLRSDTG